MTAKGGAVRASRIVRRIGGGGGGHRAKKLSCPPPCSTAMLSANTCIGCTTARFVVDPVAGRSTPTRRSCSGGS